MARWRIILAGKHRDFGAIIARVLGGMESALLRCYAHATRRPQAEYEKCGQIFFGAGGRGNAGQDREPRRAFSVLREIFSNRLRFPNLDSYVAVLSSIRQTMPFGIFFQVQAAVGCGFFHLSFARTKM